MQCNKFLLIFFLTLSVANAVLPEKIGKSQIMVFIDVEFQQ